MFVVSDKTINYIIRVYRQVQLLILLLLLLLLLFQPAYGRYPIKFIMPEFLKASIE